VKFVVETASIYIETGRQRKGSLTPEWLIFPESSVSLKVMKMKLMT
jgi:hypothetical protein